MIVIAHWRNHHIITLHVCKRQRHRMRIFECSYFQISTYFHITLLASKSRCLNHQNLLISQNCTGVPYGTGLKNVWYLVSALVNSTVFVECVIGGHLSMVDLINSCFIMQHFHLASERERSCYCHLTTPNERDDIAVSSLELCVWDCFQQNLHLRFRLHNIQVQLHQQLDSSNTLSLLFQCQNHHRASVFSF